MKQLGLISTLLLLIGGVWSCSKNQVELHPDAPEYIAVLSFIGNIAGQTLGQQRELDRVIRWMDVDIIESFERSGCNAQLIKSRNDYRDDMGMLLTVEIADFNAGYRSARAFVGFGGGSASLELDYSLRDADGAILLSWKDSAYSNKDGTHCARALNRRATERVVSYLNEM